MADKTIFDYLNNIYMKGNLEYDRKVCPSYLLSMWLSHDKNLVDIVNEVNTFQFFLTDQMIYQYYWHKIPKGKRYIKWVKKVENKGSKEKFDEVRKELSLSKREMGFYKNFDFTNTKKCVKVKKDGGNASSIFL